LNAFKQNMRSKFGSIRCWRGSFQVRDGKDANIKSKLEVWSINKNKLLNQTTIFN